MAHGGGGGGDDDRGAVAGTTVVMRVRTVFLPFVGGSR